jgi:hypothetical protein
MRKYEDACCGCATESYPCMGSSCPNRNVLHVYCDICKEDCDPDDVYDVGGEDVCEDCLLKMYPKITI